MASHSKTPYCIMMLIMAIWSSGVRASASYERQQLVVVVGASGLPRFGEAFLTWAERWQNATAGTDIDCEVIGRQGSAADKSTLVEAVTHRVSAVSPEPLWIVLIGHGTYDGRTARFNLRGPDVTASEIADLLGAAQRPVIIINCASSSAPFINQLSGSGRTIVTATRDGSQIQFARFGDALSAAIGGMEADLDQDEQVSLLEACVLASRRTVEFYESEGRLATEHALLDDNGDGKGTRWSDWQGVRLMLESELENPDGGQARKFHLVRSKAERELTVEQRQKRDQLETRLEELRKRRYEFTEAEYLNQLESIVRPLAEVYRDAEQVDNKPSPSVDPN